MTPHFHPGRYRATQCEWAGRNALSKASVVFRSECVFHLFVPSWQERILHKRLTPFGRSKAHWLFAPQPPPRQTFPFRCRHWTQTSEETKNRVRVQTSHGG